MYALTEELDTKTKKVGELTKRVNALEVSDVRAPKWKKELAESSRIREQQYQQLLLLSTKGAEKKESGNEDSLRVTQFLVV